MILSTTWSKYGWRKKQLCLEITSLSHQEAQKGLPQFRVDTLVLQPFFQSFRKLATARFEISAVVLSSQTWETDFFERRIGTQFLPQLRVRESTVPGMRLVFAVYLSQKPTLNLLLQPNLERLFYLKSVFSLHDQAVVQRNMISTHLDSFYDCKNTQI